VSLQQADAKAVMEHFQSQLKGADPDTSEQGINFLLAAGAQGEVLQALELRLQNSPADPYAQAVSIEVGCWDPATRQQAQLDATQWLHQHPAHHLKDYVQVRKDWLDEGAGHMDNVSSKQAVAQLFPLLAIGLAFLLCTLGLRALFKRA
jgi:hypothetical protein